ncbi:hypothetical protein OG895_44195 [Streptomyces sp. NBC_00201]|uniref:hypothetical protein n=1 Tax=unclassified Streptomyces TaxID=2593676 RepID=UPI0022507108|nr:hypothetical protein [Streptomyces sp. NBC_00201]MCX5252044.1 hypothetical protein [Streptomyces sp. NBC_00201]
MARITAARATPAGGRFLVAGEEFECCGSGQARRVYVTEVAGRRRNLTHEEEAAFWSWATVEVLRHTGIRIEEMLELRDMDAVADLFRARRAGGTRRIRPRGAAPLVHRGHASLENHDPPGDQPHRGLRRRDRARGVVYCRDQLERLSTGHWEAG